MEDRLGPLLELNGVQTLDRALDCTSQDMNLSYTTITTRTNGVALIMSNDYASDYTTINTGRGDREILECKLPSIHENSDKLCSFFQRFNYFVYRKQNIDKQEFIKLCKRLAAYKYPTNCNRLVVAFSGCGFDGVLQLQSGERMFLEDVISYFKPPNAELGGMICIFFIDTYHGSPWPLSQDDSEVIKAGDDCRCLTRLEVEPNLFVAYSSTCYHDQDVENFSLHGKWTGCLADELGRSSTGQSLQNVLTIINKKMLDIATAARCYQTADYCSLSENTVILPSLDTTISSTIAQ